MTTTDHRSNSFRIEYENRDPNNLNEYVHISWYELFGEPINVRSPECSWSLSKFLYQKSKQYTYLILSIFISPIVAIFCGILVSCSAFKSIWCVNPSIKICKITCAEIRYFILIILQATIVPCFEAIGYLFSNITIKKINTNDSSNNKDILII